ncbi:phage tail protein [Paenibacillus terreus]|uniref:Phage tail protein n=1 Tax=Paenibacillus terreus TaxID=1387834 RepID=A0ABV5B159_9BACL
MASNTENLNLLKKDPLTDGNETFNIKTMLNDNWDKIDEAVGSLKDEIANLDPEIPDGSTVQKGIVQLSNATNSTSEALAATPKAVKAAYDLANSKQDRLKLIDNFAASNSPIDLYPEGESVFIAAAAGSIGPGWLTAAFGDQGSQYCMVITYRSGAWGFQTVQEIYTGASSTDKVYQRRAMRVKRDSNSFWQPFIRDIDSTGGTIEKAATTSNGWQSAHVEIRNPGSSASSNMPRIALHSEGAGVAKQIAGDHIRGGVSVLNENGDALTDFNARGVRASSVSITGEGANSLDLIGSTHVYMELFPKGTAVGRKSYIGFGDPNSNNMHIANEYPDGDVVVQTRGLGISIYGLYTGLQDAKQSGVDAKNLIVGAANSKGAGASTADSWQTIANKISGIVQGGISAVYSNRAGNVLGVGWERYVVQGNGYWDSAATSTYFNVKAGGENRAYMITSNPVNLTPYSTMIVDFGDSYNGGTRTVGFVSTKDFNISPGNGARMFENESNRVQRVGVPDGVYYIIIAYDDYASRNNTLKVQDVSIF